MSKLSNQIKISIKQVFALLKADIKYELRTKYAVSGILLYVALLIILLFLSIENLAQELWLPIFLILILITSINIIAKSFTITNSEERIYNYQLFRPNILLLSKMIYNFLLLGLVSLITLLFYYLIFGFPVLDLKLFIIGLILLVLSFSTLFTTMSSIATQTGSNGIIMPILCFPVIIPQLMLLQKVLRSAFTNQGDINLYNDILTSIAIIVVLFTLSLMLFPYIWRK